MGESPVGKHWIDLIFSNDRLILREALEILLSSEGEYRFRYRLGISESDVRVLDTIGIRIIDPPEQSPKILLVSRDITRYHRLEQQYFQSQKMEGLGTLSTGIAHDFNNILGIIWGYINRVDQYRTNEKKFRNGVNTILRAVERGMSITKMVLTFARKSDAIFQPTNLNMLCDEVKHLIEETFPRTVRCFLNLYEPISAINANPNQIQQALINLCNNARDAMMDHGTISIGTRIVSGELIRRDDNTESVEQYVALSVTDTGIGMDESVSREIFNPFYTTKDYGGGTGIGLSVVQEIVKAHHGFIKVESALGQGSRFTLFLPAMNGSVNISSDTKPLATISHTGTETVLIAEDEIALAVLLRDTLIDNGYTVITARDGKEAVELFREYHHHIGIVVVDIGLPHIDGFETCRRLKQQKPGLKVICSTGYIAPNLDEKIRLGGFDALVRKPCNVEDILMTIRDVLDNTGG
jgi:two-component system cell cycle sensor histidine kinase/response regulator CckA